MEWRVINAADYGFVQRRRRTFIFATRDASIKKKLYGSGNAGTVLTSSGFFAPAFPCTKKDANADTLPIDIPEDLVKLSEGFGAAFGNCGYSVDFTARTCDVTPVYDGPCTMLGDILVPDADEKYYVSENDIPKWEYMKGAKKEKRVTKEGFEYNYSEGPIAYPDFLDRPARTMLTSEGSKNRSSHIIKDPVTGRLRILTPVECERIDGFPDNWTEGMTDRMRYFCMGNALVVGLIELMGERIKDLM